MTARLDWSRLHSKILRSSIWTEEPMVRLVWICCLADSDTHGIFHGDEATLARAWNLSVEDVTSGLTRLTEPDPSSTDPEHEGRRIVRENPTTWRIYNKGRYNPPKGEPAGASTARVRKFRQRRRGETPETPETPLEESRGEESRGEKKREGGASPGGDASPPSSFSFKVAGKGDRTWALPSPLLAELIALYPSVDVAYELQKAAAKIRAGAVHAKTARGMPRFLHSWMERAQNGSRTPGPPPAAPASPIPANPLGLRLAKDGATVYFAGAWYGPHRDGRRWLTEDGYRPDGTPQSADPKDAPLNEKVWTAMNRLVGREATRA